MKTLKFFSLLFFVTALSIPCSAQTTNNKENTIEKSGDIQVYYFHNTRRCATCKAVEDVSKSTVEELYGDKNVAFTAFNLELEDGEQKAKELGVSGQTLIIVSGDNKINITNEGFMNARNNPDKFKQIIKDKIDSLL